MEWLRLAGSLVILATNVYLVQLAIFHVPELGFELAPSTWQVVHTETCTGDACLRSGDRIHRIGSVAFDQFVRDRSLPLVAGSDPIEIEFEREGAVYVVAYTRPDLPPVKKLAKSLVTTLAPAAFWLSGTIALLFLRPLGRRGLMYVVLFYALSVFFAAGWSGWSHVGYSWYFLRLTSWLLVPLLVHFHAVVSEVRGASGWSVTVAYATAAAGLIAEVLIPGIRNLVAPALLAAILLSGGLLVFGWLRSDSPRRRRTCRIMGTGLFIGITPFLLTMVLPAVVPSVSGGNSSTAEFLLDVVAILTIPLWPASYLYAVHDARNRDLRFRANLWLGRYGYYSLILTTYLSLQLVGTRLTSPTFASDLGFELGYGLALVASGLLVLGAPAIQKRFQRWVDARIFGVQYEPEEIVRQFARRFPAAIDLPRLRDLVSDELLPTLMIRQSSLYLFAGEEVKPVYISAPEGLPNAETLRWIAEEPDVLAATGRLRESAAPWVRLVLPITVDRRVLGIWLFGDRDPDDVYSASDVDLLRSLAGMIGAVIQGQQAASAKSTLLTNVSHEIRTPLNAILGMTQLLDRSPELSPNLRAHTATIRSRGRALLGLVDDILELADEQTNSLAVRHHAFSLEDLLRRAVRRGQPSAYSKELEIRLDDRSVRGTFVGDRVRIGRVLDLLVANAIKFTDRGEVVVGASRCRGPENTLRIWVEDTGVGVPEIEQRRIFESFTQVDSTMTRKHEGMGLGLAICHQLARRMDGDLGLESEEGAGSRFWLDLQLPSARPEMRVKKPTAQWTATDRRRYRVLVAEDDLTNVLIVESMLDQLDCWIEVVGDGEQALSRAFADDFDLVLMDCKMPVMSGLEATTRVRQREDDLGLPRLPIVAHTAHTLPEEIDRCFQVGMDEVLVKPVRLEDLRDLLDRQTGSRRV